MTGKRKNSSTEDGKLCIDRAIVVEGRDDVAAVSAACDALIIPTHGFGITQETWAVIAKAYDEKGLIILTDPDHAGEEIRRRLSEKFPGSVQCFLAREDAVSGDDIGIENACPEDIRAALSRALELHEAAESRTSADTGAVVNGHYREVRASDIRDLGLSGADGSKSKRAAVCKALGIGFCNSHALVKRLKGFRIGYEELLAAVMQLTETDEQKS